MSNLTSVGVVNGIPNSGTGTVSTLDNLVNLTIPVSLATAPSTPVTGTFWQTTQPVSVASLPLPTSAMQQTGGTVGLVAGTAAIGKVNTNPGAAQLTVTAINFASGSQQNIVAAGTGSQTIKVYRLYMVVSAATNITFADGVVTDGAIPLAANEAIVLTFDGEPWFVGAAATAFKVTSSNASAQVTGRIYTITS